MPTEPQIRLVDFDAVFPNTISIKRNGLQLDLRDDVPLEEVVRVFPMLERQDALRGQENASEFLAAFEDVRRMALERCTAFIQHSYPNMTEDEVADWLTFEQQLQVVMLFFQARSSLSSAPLSAPDDASRQQAPQANRATRRMVDSETASRQRALPRPPRLSHPSPGKAATTTRRTG